MKRLFHYANEYAKQSDWKDFALVKFCLAAIGVLIGIATPRRFRKPMVFGAITVFAATYLPLMTKFCGILLGDKTES